MSISSFEPTEKQIAALKASEHFDPDWYREKYPDVDALGLDPAMHYLRYGQYMERDPGPNFDVRFARIAFRLGDRHEPVGRLAYLERKAGKKIVADHKVVLRAALVASEFSGDLRAIDLAAEHIPDEFSHTVDILRANAAIARGDGQGWQNYVNQYLANFDLKPIALRDGERLFDRLATAPLPPVTGGPKVTVIMPAWNAEHTVRGAAQSILDQTWRNIELIIVDDFSSDRTWMVMGQIAAQDDRVKIIRNSVNVGPYVSKNVALTMATGEYVTGHDADDWALPERIAKHVAEARARDLDASMSSMIRMQPGGKFAHIGPIGSFSFDGVARKASISCMFRTALLRERLGFWDCVRFGADSELIERATRHLGERFAHLKTISMICLDLETSLTNHSTFGVDKTKGISPIRANYRNAWSGWLDAHPDISEHFLEFPQSLRRYPADPEMVVPLSDIEKLGFQRVGESI